MGYKEILSKVRSEGRTALSEFESRSILMEFGVPVNEGLYFEDLDELKKMVGRIEYPVVLKGISRYIAHKTERDLVRLYIKNESEMVSEFQSLIKKDEVEGVLISPQIADRREFLLGLKHDPQFGYVVIFGLGGIFTEVFKDISMRICPIDKKEANDMIYEIKSHRLLGKIRGYDEVDIESLIDSILRIANIPTLTEEVSEIDINPLMFDRGKAVAADALIVLKD